MAKVAAAVEQGELLLVEARAEEAAVVAAGGSPGGALERLNGGTLAWLELAVDTVRGTHEVLQREGVENIDLKLLRTGLDAGATMGRLSMRAAENEFTRRKIDAVELLAEAIAAEKNKPPAK